MATTRFPLWLFAIAAPISAPHAQGEIKIARQATVSVFTEVKATGETVFGKDVIASCTSPLQSPGESLGPNQSPELRPEQSSSPCERLKALAICPAPRLGQSKRLTVAQLDNLLGPQIAIAGSAAVLTISRPARQIRRQQLSEAFNRQLAQDVHPYSQERRVSLKSLTALGPISVEDAPVTISFPALHEPLPDKSWFKSEVVIAQPDLGTVASFPIAIHLATKQRVVSLARAVQAGSPLTAKDLRFSYIDQHRVTSRHFVTKASAIGLKARHTQQRGTVLLAYQWHNPNLIPSRKKIAVTLKGKNFAIRTTGTTLEGGKKGDTIWLQVGKKAKRMQGKILDSETAEVSL